MACSNYNNGDTLQLLLDYTVNGDPLEEYEPDEIEFCIGDNRFLLSDGTVSIDEATGKYSVSVSQSESFLLSALTWYQIRIRKGTEVISSGMDKLNIGPSISDEVV